MVEQVGQFGGFYAMLLLLCGGGEREGKGEGGEGEKLDNIDAEVFSLSTPPSINLAMLHVVLYFVQAIVRTRGVLKPSFLNIFVPHLADRFLQGCLQLEEQDFRSSCTLSGITATLNPLRCIFAMYKRAVSFCPPTTSDEQGQEEGECIHCHLNHLSQAILHRIFH